MVKVVTFVLGEFHYSLKCIQKVHFMTKCVHKILRLLSSPFAPFFPLILNSFNSYQQFLSI